MNESKMKGTHFHHVYPKLLVKKQEPVKASAQLGKDMDRGSLTCLYTKKYLNCCYMSEAWEELPLSRSK